MKVLFITGKIKKNTCGVCDYSMNLMDSLTKYSNLEIKQLNFNNVKISDIKKSGVIILNYPCPEYGKSLLPHFLIILSKIFSKRIIYVMHEFSYVKVLRKLVILPFILMANNIVSVTEEQIRSFPKFIANKMNFIPIASNITTVKSEKGKDEINKEFIISYFGVFYPAKKVEDIIMAFSKLSTKSKNNKLKLIGAVHPSHVKYVDDLKELIKKENIENCVEWKLNVSDVEVIDDLKNTDVCILPFKEGVTMRRSTFLTAISLEIPTITSLGKDTPFDLKKCKSVLFANNVEDIIRKIIEVKNNYRTYKTEAKNAKGILGFKDWDDIGGEFSELINRKY